MGFSKFFDDSTYSIKPIEDGATLKPIEDIQTYAFRDTPFHEGLQTLVIDTIGGETVDETLVENTLAESSYTMAENVFNQGNIFGDPAYLSAQPFVLANPHHTMAWRQTFSDPNDPQTRMSQYETLLAQIDLGKKQLQDQLRQMDEYRSKIDEEYSKLKDSQANSKG